MQPSFLFQVLRLLGFLAGVFLSYFMCLMLAYSLGLNGGGRNQHDLIRANSALLFFMVPAVLGLFALFGTHYPLMRTLGRIVICAIAPILLGAHLWIASKYALVDPGWAAKLVIFWVATFAAWEGICHLGWRHQTKRLSRNTASSTPEAAL